VHNLRLAGGTDTPAWAIEFDAYVRDALVRGDDDALSHFDTIGAIDAAAKLAVPTREHYLPLLYVSGTRYEEEAPIFHTEAFDWGSISMRSVSYGL
jgi:4,5-DOPA dioxygenase extradiol